MVTQFTSDVDIDLADRTEVLKLIKHIKAMQVVDGLPRKHNSGIYATPIPYDGLTGLAAIDYKEAEERGYTKIDLLNVSVYSLVRDPDHYEKLLSMEPPWARLLEKDFCEKLVHLSRWHSTIVSLTQPIDSIPRLAMFLAAIRPGKKHLLGKPWAEVAASVWDKDGDGGYSFKHSHSISYAVLVALHMNILNEQFA